MIQLWKERLLMKHLTNLNKQYRIHRLDSRNIAIQKWVATDKKSSWHTISYHGNSIKSLAMALSTLIVQSHTPEDVELSEQLRIMELDVISGLVDIQKMIREYCREQS